MTVAITPFKANKEKWTEREEEAWDEGFTTFHKRKLSKVQYLAWKYRPTHGPVAAYYDGFCWSQEESG